MEYDKCLNVFFFRLPIVITTNIRQLVLHVRFPSLFSSSFVNVLFLLFTHEIDFLLFVCIKNRPFAACIFSIKIQFAKEERRSNKMFYRDLFFFAFYFCRTMKFDWFSMHKFSTNMTREARQHQNGVIYGTISTSRLYFQWRPANFTDTE